MRFWPRGVRALCWCHTYLLIQLAGGRGLVAQLRLTVHDRQLQPGGTVAVRRAQRDRWDATGEEKGGENDGDECAGEVTTLQAVIVQSVNVDEKKLTSHTDFSFQSGGLIGLCVCNQLRP